MAQTTINLGAATNFAVLAGSGITNTGTTVIVGDVGTYPTTTETGFGTVTILGTNHGGDAVTQSAKADLVTAYNDAASRTPVLPISGNLGGQVLVPGVYQASSSILLNGTLTLDAQGDPNAVFIFQIGSTITTGSGSNITLINGAQHCRVFWQVGSSATLGTNSIFAGTIMAFTSITATTGVTVDGRLLARNGAVTMDTNRIMITICSEATRGVPFFFSERYTSL